MKTVITYGTFDVLHAGHINLLRRARMLGDRLIVGLSTDQFNKGKRKCSLLGFDNRKAVLSAIQYVDSIIPEKTWEQKVSDIIANDVDVFVIGEDWRGHFDYLSEYCEVMYLPRSKGISSTLIRSEIGTHPRSELIHDRSTYR